MLKNRMTFALLFILSLNFIYSYGGPVPYTFFYIMIVFLMEESDLNTSLISEQDKRAVLNFYDELIIESKNNIALLLFTYIGYYLGRFRGIKGIMLIPKILNYFVQRVISTAIYSLPFEGE